MFVFSISLVYILLFLCLSIFLLLFSSGLNISSSISSKVNRPFQKKIRSIIILLQFTERQEYFTISHRGKATEMEDSKCSCKG